MRKLASIQKVLGIQKIYDKEGNEALNIEAVTINGWTCVAKKGLHKVGDPVVYFEIDSIIPIKILKELNLWNEEKGKGMLSRKQGNVLSTKRMLGVISQGLVAPVTKFPEIDDVIIEGDDVTSLLGITKYEKYVEEENESLPKKTKFKKRLLNIFRPILMWLIYKIPIIEKPVIKLSKKISFVRMLLDKPGPFPSFIFKTDQMRVQNLSKTSDFFFDEYEITEKMEGTSSTYFYNKGDYGICSRNQRRSNYDTTHFGQIEKKYDIFNKLKKYKQNIALQGEICGPGIQGNYYKLESFQWFIFDVFLIDEQRKALHGERIQILKELDLLGVEPPFLGYISLDGQSSEELVKRAEKKSLVFEGVEMEGMVYKSLKHPTRSFKAISNKFLLKNGG